MTVILNIYSNQFIKHLQVVFVGSSDSLAKEWWEARRYLQYEGLELLRSTDELPVSSNDFGFVESLDVAPHRFNAT